MMEEIMFKKGEKVKHVLEGEYLLVLKIGKEQILCRTKDFREIWFYEYELEKL